jgi:hypothetical protein
MNLRAIVFPLLALFILLPAGASAQGSKPLPGKPAARAAGEAVIMKMIYGNYDPRTKTSVWQKPTKAALEMVSQNAGPLYSQMIGYFPFLEDGSKKVMFVTASAPRNFDCHACAPVLSVAVFSQDAGKWKLETAESALTASGSWGKAGEVKLEQIGPEKHAVVVKSGFTAQGETSETAFFYAQEGGKFKQVLVLDTHRDNGGNCGPGMQPCYDFTSTYELKAGGSGEYYNVIVSTTGTPINSQGKPAPAKKREIYVFRDGEYKAGLGK